jgi:hypothetical protein
MRFRAGVAGFYKVEGVAARGHGGLDWERCADVEGGGWCREVGSAER